MTVKIEHKIPSSAFIDAFNMMNIEFVGYASPNTNVGCRLSDVKIKDDNGDIYFYNKENFLELHSQDFTTLEIYDNNEMDFIAKTEIHCLSF